MQKIFQNCYEMDRKCYEKYNLNEDILMEHAASAMERFIRAKFAPQSLVLIVAGSGNNGADGVTLARLLVKDYKVGLYLPFGVKSQMAKLQLERAELVGVELVDSVIDADVIVDALFGAGLNRALQEPAALIIESLNAMSGYKIACDIPSGLDVRGNPSPVAFVADTTITMGALKESLFLDAAKDYVGKIEVANLGVSRVLYEDESSTFLLERSDFKPPLRERRNCHKGSFGHTAIFCGDKEGAATIAAMAATRFGTGLTTVVAHKPITLPPYIMQATSVPQKATAIALGMGLGNFFEDEVFEKEVINVATPVVLDADALYKKNLLEIIKQKREVVITPHPKEFCSLVKIVDNIDISVQEVQQNRYKLARDFSQRYPHCTLLLKGANPIIAQNGKLYVNPLGSNVLAKGGSGDILSGLIASLLAQGYGALQATINGSLALALASARYTRANYFLIPTDIIELLGDLDGAVE